MRRPGRSTTSRSRASPPSSALPSGRGAISTCSEKLEFAAVISPDNNDPPDWREWTDAGKTEARIAALQEAAPGGRRGRQGSTRSPSSS